MLSLGLYFLFIIILGLYIKNIVLFFLFNFIVVVILRIKHKIKYKYIFTLILMAIIIFSRIYFKEIKFEKLYSQIKECQVIGIIVSSKQEKQYTNKYTIEVYNVNNQKKYKNTRLILYSKENYDFGDIVKIKGEFKYADGVRNENGFNYRQYLKQLNCYGFLYSNLEEKISNKKSVLSIINILNIKASNIIFSIYSNEENELLNAMLIGNRNELSDDIKYVFKTSSLSHILAISGLHINYITETLRKILNRFINSKFNKDILIILFLIFFCIFTGASPSCLRACFMISFSIVADLVYKKNDKINSIVLSIILILFINPYYFENIGLWLSFGGIIGINLFNNFIKSDSNSRIQKYILDNLNLTLKVQIIIFPIILYSFNTISFSFLISNIFVSFLILPIIVLGYLSIVIGALSTTFTKYSIGFIESKIIELFLLIAKFISEIRVLNYICITPSLISLVVYYFVLYLICFKKINIRNKKHKLVLFVLIVIIILSNFNFKLNSDLEIHFLDQTTPNMIQRISGIFERKPLISRGI